ncbi:MAG: DUF3253 domain-containing protein [Balneola sp.]|nr:MAG: DUF3253 domain-containing protein [Balneola sp.]
MKKSKPEPNANILHITQKQAVKKSKEASEVARSLFSETWRVYMDGVNMVSVKMTKSKGETKIDRSKKPVRLSLVD